LTGTKRIAETLDRCLRERASQDVKRLMANCFVAIDPATKAIAGYYTLAATSIPVSDLPLEILKRLPRYPVLPAALIGRLAADRRFHPKGLGDVMLAGAALRVLKSDTKALALVVDAKDDNAVAFYEHHGFQRFASKPRSLFLPLYSAFAKEVGGPVPAGKR